MEHNTPPTASAPSAVQFQVSLLRLIYPDAKVSGHVAELEQMLAPAGASVVRG